MPTKIEKAIAGLAKVLTCRHDMQVQREDDELLVRRCRKCKMTITGLKRAVTCGALAKARRKRASAVRTYRPSVRLNPKKSLSRSS